MTKESAKGHKTCEWTREKTAALITLYQSHQCLWNNFTEAYKNKDKRMKAIESICSQLNITKTDFGKKIHNLRNQFNAEMKKLDKRNESSTEVYRSRWEHYEALRFLRDVIAPRPGYSVTMKGPRKYEIKYSLVEEDQQNSNGAIEDEVQFEEATDANSSPLEFTEIPVVSREEILESKYHVTNSNDCEHQEYIHTVQQPQQHHRTPPQTVVHISESSSVQAAPSTSTLIGMETMPLKKRPGIENPEDQQRDQWDIFGEFVASEFKNLNSELSRKKLKRKIMQAMLEVGAEDDGININISLN